MATDAERLGNTIEDVAERLFALTAVLESMEDATGMPVDVVQTPLLADSLLDIERPVPLYAAA